MEEKDPIQPIFTAEMMARYHNGQLSAAEMHALEKAALEDPFLSDALEGYATTTPAQASHNMDDLRQRLLQRVSPKKSRILPLWSKVAAAIVIITGAGIVLYNTLTPHSEPKPYIARVEPTAALDSINMPKIETLANPRNVSPSPTIQPPPAFVSSRRTLHKTGKLVFKQGTEGKTTTPQAAPNTDSTAIAINHTDNETIYKEPIPTLRQDSLRNNDPIANALSGRAAGIQIQHSAQKTTNNFYNPQPNIFNGRITDQNNHPVANASIQVVSTNQNILSDQNGFFTVKAIDSAQLKISSVGFDDYRLLANKLRNDSTIRLQYNSNAINEVVIVGYGNKHKSRPAIGAYRVFTDSSIVEPLGGWNNFDNYLSQNLHWPEDLNTNDHITGKVELSFDIQRDGTISNIKVEKSLCESCDAEAIRLLQQGPRWQLKKGKKAKAAVQVKF